jgi:hypothetical protein
VDLYPASRQPYSLAIQVPFLASAGFFIACDLRLLTSAATSLRL